MSLEQIRFDTGRKSSDYLARQLGAEGAWQFLMNSSVLASEENPKLRWAVAQAIHALCGDIPPGLKTDLFGKTYRSPIGLGPGIIKEHMGALDLWREFPFGFIDIGGITGEGQAGNPSPRIWRHDRVDSARNAMRLPGPGIDNIVSQLGVLKLQKRLPDALWANLCNSLSTKTDQDKIDEFAMMVKKIWDYVDVIELNFSCPNQHGSSDGVQKSQKLLEAIIKKVQEINEQQARMKRKVKKPILVKIGPVRPEGEYPINTNDDLSPEELEMIVETCVKCGVEGIVANNTAKNHLELGHQGKGGMSGKLLHARSIKTIESIARILGRDPNDMTSGNLDMMIIGAGGVGTGSTIQEVKKTGVGLLNAGAEAQIMVTGFALNPASIHYVNEAVKENGFGE